ncbi:MAG: hypothetical protein WC995_01850 [Lysobacteraceae bacterium]
MSRHLPSAILMLSLLLAAGSALAEQSCPDTVEADVVQREDEVTTPAASGDNATPAPTRTTVQAPANQPANARARWHRYLPGMFK